MFYAVLLAIAPAVVNQLQAVNRELYEVSVRALQERKALPQSYALHPYAVLLNSDGPLPGAAQGHFAGASLNFTNSLKDLPGAVTCLHLKPWCEPPQGVSAALALSLPHANGAAYKVGATVTLWHGKGADQTGYLIHVRRSPEGWRVERIERYWQSHAQ